MGKLMLLLYFILSVFPADATENRRHIHVVRRGSKKSHRGDTVAKIWIEENGEKKIEVAWSELTADEETLIIQAIDKHWDELNRMIDDVFAGKKGGVRETTECLVEGTYKSRELNRRTRICANSRTPIWASRSSTST